MIKLLTQNPKTTVPSFASRLDHSTATGDEAPGQICKANLRMTITQTTVRPLRDHRQVATELRSPGSSYVSRAWRELTNPTWLWELARRYESLGPTVRDDVNECRCPIEADRMILVRPVGAFNVPAR